jgi:Domain of unknown function (DUF1992)
MVEASHVALVTVAGMTPRKPPSVSFPDWVEQQIRTAEAQGAFENLPGAGKPIPDLGRIAPADAWVVNYLRRENADIAAALPPALALAKEAEDLPERLLTIRAESVVRELVEGLNTRIREAYQRPQVGPPMRVRPLKVEETIEQWRAGRAARQPAPLATEPIATDAGVERAADRRTGSRWRRRAKGQRN